MQLNSEAKVALKTSILSAIFTVGLLVGANYYFNHSWNLFGNSSKTQPFTVQGTGSVKATPDQAQIFFSVNKTAKTLDEAQKEANVSMDKIIADLSKAGVDKKDIKTNNYSSYPVYDSSSIIKPMMAMPRPGTQTISGYTVNNSVTVTIHETDKANTIIDLVTADGAENVSGPNFTISEDVQKKLMDEARTQAINEAKTKAENMAKAAGIHLGKLVSIQEGGSYPVPMMAYGAARMDSASSAPIETKLNPGENTVNASVTLSYETW